MNEIQAKVVKVMRESNMEVDEALLAKLTPEILRLALMKVIYEMVLEVISELSYDEIHAAIRDAVTKVVKEKICELQMSIVESINVD